MTNYETNTVVITGEPAKVEKFIAEALKPDQWLFVDRIHFTDQGHDFVSKLILDVI